MDKNNLTVGDAVIYNHHKLGAIDVEIVELHETYAIIKDLKGDYYDAFYKELENY